MKLNRKQHVLVGVTGIIMLLIVILQAWHVREQDMAIERERSAMNAQVYADELQKDFERGISITETMKTLLIENDGEIDHFETIAQELMEDYIGSIQIAPAGVVTEIYPLQGNEAGRIDLMHDENRGPVANYGKDHHMVTMQGPFALTQGGFGIAIRNPVYLRDANNEQYFWGFTIVIIKSPEIYEQTLHALSTFGYEYYLETTKSPLSQDRALVASTVGSNDTLVDPVIHVFEAGGCTWALKVAPKGGWGYSRTPTVLVGGLVFSLLITILAYLFMRVYAQRQRLKELAEEARSANEAKTNFLTNMAHDIRVPLSSMMGLAALTENHLDDPVKTRFYLSQIRTAGEHLTRILNNVLEISRIESDQLVHEETAVDVQEVYDNLKLVVENQVKARDLTIRFSEQVEHKYLYIDRVHVSGILFSLVSNAMNYTPAGGAIDVNFTELPGVDAEHVVIQAVIRDNGFGMSEAEQKKLLLQLEREESEGMTGVEDTGLGISIVKKLVDMMHGTITIDSKRNLGTAVTVQIPHRIAQAPDAGITQMEDVDWDLFEGKRILIAEDDDINALIVAEMLAKQGVLVERASNGQACLDLLNMHPAQFYDLILMDIQMPIMDGYQATRRIRSLPDQEKAVTPIVAMTANVFLEDRIKVIGAGMNAHLGKPVDMDQLFLVLYRVLKHRDMYVDSTQLQEFQRKYQDLGCPCGYFIYHDDTEQSVMYVDEATAVIYGYRNPGEFRKAIQHSFRNMVHPEDLEAAQQAIEQQQNESEDGIDRISYRIIRKDGKVRKIQDIGYKAMSGDTYLYYVYIADVTDLEKNHKNSGGTLEKMTNCHASVPFLSRFIVYPITAQKDAM